MNEVKYFIKQTQYKDFLSLSQSELQRIIKEILYTKANRRAQQCGLAAKVLTLYTLGSHMGASSNPGSSTFQPAPCLWPGKATEDSTRFGTLHPRGIPGRSSWILALDQHSTGRCAHLGSELSDRRSSSLSLLLSVYLTFQ